MTDYVVLRKTEIDDGWERYRLAPSARSARAAIQAVVDQDVAADQINGNEYVAIPLRSWKPVTVKVETKTALKFT